MNLINKMYKYYKYDIFRQYIKFLSCVKFSLKGILPKLLGFYEFGGEIGINCF